MPNLKIFSSSNGFIPHQWADAAGFPNHRQQGHLVVVAATKRDAISVLTERGVDEWYAEGIVKALRLSRQPVTWTHLKLLLEEGLINLDAPGVYVWNQGVKGDCVLRVDPGEEYVILGHFHTDPRFGGRGLYVQRAGE